MTILYLNVLNVKPLILRMYRHLFVPLKILIVWRQVQMILAKSVRLTTFMTLSEKFASLLTHTARYSRRNKCVWSAGPDIT